MVCEMTMYVQQLLKKRWQLWLSLLLEVIDSAVVVGGGHVGDGNIEYGE